MTYISNAKLAAFPAKHQWVAVGCVVGAALLGAIAIDAKDSMSAVQAIPPVDATAPHPPMVQPPIMASSLNCTWSCLD